MSNKNKSLPGTKVRVYVAEGWHNGRHMRAGYRVHRVLAEGLYGWGLATVDREGNVWEPVNPVCVRVAS